MTITLTIEFTEQGTCIIRHEGVVAVCLKANLVDTMIDVGAQFRDAFPNCKLVWTID